MTLAPLALVALALLAQEPRPEPRLDPGVAAPSARVALEGLPADAPRPRAHLTDGDLRRRAPVRRGEDGGWTLRVPALPAGEWDLELRLADPAGGAPTLVSQAGALHVAAPTELAASPTTARPGDVLEIAGRFFGSRRGRVRLGSRRAKVLAWEEAVVTDDAGLPLDRIRCRVPRTLGDGLHPVTVTTAAGDGGLGEAVTVVDSPRGPEPVLRGDLGDALLEARARSVRWRLLEEEGALLLRGRQPGPTRSWVGIVLPPEVLLTGTADLRGDDALVQVVRREAGDVQVWASSYGWGGHARVHVSSAADGVLRGTVTGFLAPVYGLAESMPVSLTFVAPSR